MSTRRGNGFAYALRIDESRTIEVRRETLPKTYLTRLALSLAYLCHSQDFTRLVNEPTRPLVARLPPTANE